MDVSLSELELVMDREAWRAVIHGVSKSRTGKDSNFPFTCGREEMGSEEHRHKIFHLYRVCNYTMEGNMINITTQRKNNYFCLLFIDKSLGNT